MMVMTELEIFASIIIGLQLATLATVVFWFISTKIKKGEK